MRLVYGFKKYKAYMIKHHIPKRKVQNKFLLVLWYSYWLNFLSKYMSLKNSRQ